MNKKLKWFCVQPLTGGAYLGAEEAIGYKADGVISFQDFAGFSKDKEGNVIAAANEQILVEYLKQKNRLPDWYMLNHAPFVADTNFNPGFIRPEGMDFVTKNDAPDYSNTDLVVAVPFCSGLSMSSTANDEHKAMRNCNMVWIANYVIRTIQPKIYLFENAPTLMSVRGTEMRMAFEKLASETGYSVVYYKTDTKLHHNCQRRPRTFIMLIKHRNGKAFIPEFRYEQDTISIDDFFKEMTENLTQENDPMDVCYPANDVNLTIPLAYIKHVFGANWREHDECHGDIIAWACADKAKQIDMLKYIKETYPEDTKSYNWFERYFNHINAKFAIGKGYWSTIARFPANGLPACMYKTVPAVIHYKEDRLYTMREWFYAMGHPTDMNMIGTPASYASKMGQNVPVKTAKWVVSEAQRILNNYDKEISVTGNDNVAYFDNTRMKRVW